MCDHKSEIMDGDTGEIICSSCGLVIRIEDKNYKPFRSSYRNVLGSKMGKKIKN